MAQLLFRAGNFEIETWTDGHPMWWKIRHEGKELTHLHSIHHKELKDLAYVLERMQTAMRAALPTNYKHEMD